MTPSAAQVTSRRGPSPTVTALHICALSGFAIAQPLYEVLREHPTFLVAHFAEPGDLLLLCLALSFLAPAALALPVLATRWISRSLSWALLLGVIALLGFLLGLGIARQSTPIPGLDLPLALVIAAAVTWSYGRWNGVRRLLTWMVVAAVVFPLLFLARNPIRSLLSPEVSTEEVQLAILSKTPVFLLVLDEFPLFSLLDEDELIDAERFPNIAALASDGRWYRNATTVAQSTAYGVPAILSGRYPFKEMLLPVTKDYRVNLFTLLGGAYNLNSFETGTRLCPLELCTGEVVRLAATERRVALVADLSAVYLQLVAPRGMTDRLPDIREGWMGFWGGQERRRRPGKEEYVKAKDVRKYRWDHPRETAENFLATIENFPRPTLHYLHVLLPHAPWRNTPTGRRFNARYVPGLEDRIWSGTPWQIAQGLQRHLLQVGFVDSYLGRFREKLESLNLYDDSLIVIVSDHGSGFRAGESRRLLEGASPPNLIDLANVPLIVKFPGGEPRGLDDRNAETIDVLPTILESLGLETAGLGLDGVSLAGPPPDRENKRIYPTRGRRSERGTALVFSPDRLDERREMIDFKIGYLGTGSWDRVFAAGPFGSLTGASSDDAALSTLFEVPVLDPPQKDFVDNLWVSGVLPGESADRWVALMVEDRVAAVTQTYRADGKERFGALVAPADVPNDASEVAVRTVVTETEGEDQ